GGNARNVGRWAAVGIRQGRGFGAHRAARPSGEQAERAATRHEDAQRRQRPMITPDFRPSHFGWRREGPVAVVTLTRPERKNPLTFESYAELRDTFRALVYSDDVKAVVFTSSGGNFCSGGDVHEIIKPLLDRDMKGLLSFTRMT